MRKAKVPRSKPNKSPKTAKTAKAPPSELDVHRELSHLAARLDLTLSELLALAVDEYLARSRRAVKAKSKARKRK